MEKYVQSHIFKITDNSKNIFFSYSEEEIKHFI